MHLEIWRKKCQKFEITKGEDGGRDLRIEANKKKKRWKWEYINNERKTKKEKEVIKKKWKKDGSK